MNVYRSLLRRWLVWLRSVAGVAWFGGLCALAADWPQFLGPKRDGIADETGLLLSWPKTGPSLLWEKQIGSGFSGPVVAGDRLILFHRQGIEAVIVCLSAQGGREQWTFKYPTDYHDDYGFDEGPRSTPLIADSRVYTLGAEGKLHCLELANGKKLWERSLTAEYQVRKGFFGVATSPLLEGNLLLINVGGKDAGIVAFDKDSGREMWRTTNHEASYSSPVSATLDGRRSAIFLTREGIVLLDPQTGQVRENRPWRSRMHASVNAATPVVIDDTVFFSSSYGVGAVLLRVRRDHIEELWKNDESMSNHYNTCVHHEGFLYGFDGRQEEGARLRCIELKSGKVRWTKDDFGCGSMILALDHLIILGENGDLVVVKATPESYMEQTRAKVLTKPCRSPIALSGGRLYARDTKRLVCLNLKK